MLRQAIRPSLLGLSILVLLAAPFITLAKEVPATNVINLDIVGTAGTAYSAHWTVENAGQTQEYHQKRGQVPANLSYYGNAISGTITLLSAGQLTLTVEKSGNRSRSVTQGKGSTLQFSIR